MLKGIKINFNNGRESLLFESEKGLELSHSTMGTVFRIYLCGTEESLCRIYWNDVSSIEINPKNV